MDILQAIEIFAFVTGVAYLLLEIGQKNAMWVIGILTGAACAYSFAVQHLWASMGLNIYYVFVSVWGLVQWRRDSRMLATEQQSNGQSADIHLRHLPMDAIVAVLSAIGTWWLAKSYPQQWLIWILADTLSTVLCLSVGMYWMALLYLAYTASAVYGYFHWNRKGVWID